MTHRDGGAPVRPASLVARLGWGTLGVLASAWTVFEAAKHAGPTIPCAAIGLLLPFLSRLAPGSTLAANVLLRVWIPLAVMGVCSVIPGSADSTAAPFTLGLAWLSHLAVRRAIGLRL